MLLTAKRHLYNFSMSSVETTSLKINRKTKYGWQLHAICIIYVVFIALGFFVHENFCDEAQAWLIARDLNIGGIFSQMKYEGHFMLWYLILYPFAKLGVSYKVVNVISAIFMAVSGGLVIYKSPFSSLQKCLVLGTAPMLYAFSTIAIRYSMAPLFLFLIAVNYKDKMKHPFRYSVLLILLSNVHVLIWGLVIALCLDYFIEIFKVALKDKKIAGKYIGSLALLGVGLILTILPIVGSVSTNDTLNKASANEFLGRFASMILEHFEWCFFAGRSKAVLCLVAVIAIIISVYGLIYARKAALIGLSGVLFQNIVLASLYHTVWQKSLFIIIDLIFALWIVALNKTDDSTLPKFRMVFLWITRIGLMLLIVLSVGDGLLALRDDALYSYSSGKDAATFITENIGEDATIVTLEEIGPMATICGYMPKDSGVVFYQLRHGYEFTFVTWDENDIDYLDSSLEQRIDEKYGDEENLYYIHLAASVYNYEESNIMCEEYVNSGYFTPVFISGDNLSEESFIIYKINR